MDVFGALALLILFFCFLIWVFIKIGESIEKMGGQVKDWQIKVAIVIAILAVLALAAWIGGSPLW